MPIIQSTPFNTPPGPPGSFGEGAYFNGTTAYLERANTGIIPSNAGSTFISCWVQLRAKTGNPEEDSFLLGGVGGPGNTVLRTIDYGPFNTGSENYNYNGITIRYWHDFQYSRNFTIGYSQSIDDQFRTSMTHVVVESTGPFSAAGRVWINGTLLGTTSLSRSTVIDTNDDTPTSIMVGRYLKHSGDFYREGTIKNLVFSNDVPNNTIASDLYNVGINGNITTVSGFTPTAWYPFQSDFNDASGNGYNFTTTTDVVII